MKNTSGFVTTDLLAALFVFGLAVGWIMNVVAVVHTINLPITGMFILRAIGIVVGPLGGVLGYF